MLIESISDQLINRARGVDPFTKITANTTEEKLRLVEAPVALMGQIQAGKTRAYLGVLARCLDEEFDVGVILTRNSDVLGEQTLERVRAEFSCCDDDHTPIGARRLRALSIRELTSIRQSTRRQAKLVIVVQKNGAQLERLRRLMSHDKTANALRYLFIDDEADYNSISYEGGAPTKVMSYIFDIRKRFNGRKFNGVLAMLQVTATPGALFLQPDLSDLSLKYIALQPDYTALLEPHEAYVGMERFLGEGGALTRRRLSSDLTRALCPAEVGRRPSRAQLSQLREALITFLVAGAIRALEECSSPRPFTPPYSCACLIHLSPEQLHHRAQASRVLEAIDELVKTAAGGAGALASLLRAPLASLRASRDAAGLETPALDAVSAHLAEVLEEAGPDVEVAIINSDPLEGWEDGQHALFRARELSQLQTSSPRLELNAAFNVFIGGDAFTRGVTIDHLLMTLYAREATAEVDSLLQHARWYGARSPADLSVTRLYLSERAEQKLLSAHSFDETLRAQVKATAGRLEVLALRAQDLNRDAGVHRVTSDDRAPPTLDALEGSKVVTYTPISFDLVPTAPLAALTASVDRLVAGRASWDAGREDCWALMELIDQSLVFNRGLPGAWNHEVAKMMMTVGTGLWARSVAVTVYKDREARHGASSPLYDVRLSALQSRARREDRPLLLLFRCNGGSARGWNAEGPLYWPYLVLPPSAAAFTFFHTDQARPREP